MAIRSKVRISSDHLLGYDSMRWDVLRYVLEAGGRLLQLNFKGLGSVEEIIALYLVDIWLHLDGRLKMRWLRQQAR